MEQCQDLGYQNISYNELSGLKVEETIEGSIKIY
jgi:hypothetical protein